MRLAFYEERYKNHASSEQMAVNLRDKINGQTVRLLELGMAGTYADFLEKALDLVIYVRILVHYYSHLVAISIWFTYGGVFASGKDSIGVILVDFYHIPCRRVGLQRIHTYMHTSCLSHPVGRQN